MSTRAKTIVRTALGTTLFWIVVVVFVAWWMNPQDGPIGARFVMSQGAFPKPYTPWLESTKATIMLVPIAVHVVSNWVFCSLPQS